MPALILNGQVDELRETYKIRLIHEEGDNKLFELLPKSDQEIFTRVRLLFTEGVIAELQLEDSLGQRSSVQFLSSS
ncbi:outer-membrane lipoprotein carrier protein LolA [Aliamphritea spongicola]|nr:outer-membrane lipoprotein carrier protein LolA [Aliamphritea spongicola]